MRYHTCSYVPAPEPRIGWRTEVLYCDAPVFGSTVVREAAKSVAQVVRSNVEAAAERRPSAINSTYRASVCDHDRADRHECECGQADPEAALRFGPGSSRATPRCASSVRSAAQAREEIDRQTHIADPRARPPPPLRVNPSEVSKWLRARPRNPPEPPALLRLPSERSGANRGQTITTRPIAAATQAPRLKVKSIVGATTHVAAPAAIRRTRGSHVPATPRARIDPIAANSTESIPVAERHGQPVLEYRIRRGEVCWEEPGRQRVCRDRR